MSTRRKTMGVLIQAPALIISAILSTRHCVTMYATKHADTISANVQSTIKIKSNI